jgi:hypothetical protein
VFRLCWWCSNKNFTEVPMRHVRLAILALATVGIAACEQQAADRSPTAPDVDLSFAKALGGTCDAGRLRAITTQQGNLWVRPELTEARARLDLVSGSCTSDLAASRGYMLAYIQWTIDNRGAIIDQGSGSARVNLLAHWNTVFPYVGYTGVDQPLTVDTTIFVDGIGTAGVITQLTSDRELRTPEAAITVPVQDEETGDARPHLFVIYPLADGCLTGTNLNQLGACFEIGSFPKVAGAFDPKVKVGICPKEGSNHELGTAALGHLNGSTVEIPDQTVYPADCSEAWASNDEGSWTGGFGSVMKRVASLAGDVFGVKSAYAVHGGLGGTSLCCSHFGLVDLEVFNADFENNLIGALPDPSNANTGTWSPVTAKAPGSITISSSLGDIATKVVVLNQGGGNCKKNCGGLLLQGNLASSGSVASNGVYEAEWISLQDLANMKEAVFVLRDENGRDLARVTYAVRNNVNQILYNDVPATPTQAAIPGTLLGNWVQHTSSHFRIRVDLTAGTTSVWFNNATAPAVEDVAFVNPDASNTFKTISAVFTGIDSGNIGWDNIIVRRLEDSAN